MEIQQYGILNEYGILSLLAFVTVAGVMYGAMLKSRRLAASLGINSPSAAATRAICSILIALILSLAIIRPYWGAEDIKVKSRGDDVVFLVDISRSMFATDMPPSRLEVAKRKIKDMVATLSASGQAARFGITVFAGDGYTVCPITTDRGVLAQFVETISPDLVSSLGSNLKAGIEAALSRFDDTAKSHSRVVLLSDGEDNFFDATRAISEIHSKGVRFDVLGLGTPQGSIIQLPNGATVVDQARQPVVSVLKEAPLAEVARAGGGVYVRASLDDSDISTLTSPRLTVGQGSRVMTESSIRSYRELGPWLVLAALCCIVLATCFRGTGPLACVALLLIALQGGSQALAQDTTQASTPVPGESPFALYQQGNYQAAAEGFSRTLSRHPSDRALKHGLASSLYRLGKYDESEKLFAELVADATNGRHYYEAVYNQGNAQIKMKRYRDAIDSFRKALDVKPNDEQASHNLAVARALLEEEKRRALEPTPTPTATPTSTPTSQSQPSPQSSPSPSPEPSQPPTPSPAASPTASPGATGAPEQESPTPAEATAQPTSSGEAEDSAGATRTAAPGSTPGEPTTVPTNEANATANQAPVQPTTTDERLKEALDKEPQPPEPRETPSAASTPAESSSFPEVDAWLESLPESPLLIRRHRGAPPSNGQTW